MFRMTGKGCWVQNYRISMPSLFKLYIPLSFHQGGRDCDALTPSASSGQALTLSQRERGLFGVPAFAPLLGDYAAVYDEFAAGYEG